MTTDPSPSPNRFYDALVAVRARPFVIAHRGDSAHAPENTLEAAHLAWRRGADAWELDVHLTRDGFTVVLHDKSLLRTTDVAARFDGDPRVADGAYVADFDLDEVRALDAGTWFLSETVTHRTAAAFGTRARIAPEDHARFCSGHVRVPTLREALELTVRLDWLVNVEIKSFPTSNPFLLDAVISDLNASGTADRVLISSFDHKDVARAAARRCGAATGVLAAMPIARPERYVKEFVGADCYHASAEVLGSDSHAYRRRPHSGALRTDDLDDLKGQGVPVLVHTVNDRRPGGVASHFAEAGVSGFFSDDPEGLLTVFEEGC